jgi:Activator of Hsp90 ATPase homolog 1-like protein
MGIADGQTLSAIKKRLPMMRFGVMKHLAEMRRKYSFGAVVTSDWTPSSRYEAVGGGTPIFERENLEVEPPRRLVQSFRALWGEDVKSEGTSRVTWEIEPVGDSCLLKVTHDQLRDDANNQLYGGWPMVLSGIKTLLETGEILTTPGSLRWKTDVRIIHCE